MVPWLVRVAAAFLFGGIFSQSAEFTQQYLQRLGGAADALGKLVERFDATASTSNLSRDQALARLKANADRFVARQGGDAEATILRYEEIEQRYRGLLDTTPFLRPFVALSDPDWTIADRARGDYRPALPVTVDGLVMTVAGFVLGWAGGAGVHGAVRMRRRGRSKVRVEEV